MEPTFQMEAQLNGEILVSEVAGNRAVLVCEKPSAIASLNKLGFVSQGDQMVRPISDVADRQNIIKQLIELEAVFSSGREWSPEEVVDLYHEQGIVGTSYRVITWRGPGQFSINRKN